MRELTQSEQKLTAGGTQSLIFTSKYIVSGSPDSCVKDLFDQKDMSNFYTNFTTENIFEQFDKVCSVGSRSITVESEVIAISLGDE